MKVCNPYCGPCAKAHPIMHDILKSNNNVKFQIIFFSTNSERTKIIKHLMHINKYCKKEIVENAIDYWYLSENKNYDDFAATYKLDNYTSNEDNDVEKMSIWCKEMDIKFTPTFFLNGFQLPDIYELSDLKKLLVKYE